MGLSPSVRILDFCGITEYAIDACHTTHPVFTGSRQKNFEKTSPTIIILMGRSAAKRNVPLAFAVSQSTETAEYYSWFGKHACAAGMWHLFVVKPGRFGLKPVLFADAAKGVLRFANMFDEENLNVDPNDDSFYNSKWVRSKKDPIVGKFISGKAAARLELFDDRISRIDFINDYVHDLRRVYFTPGDVDVNNPKYGPYSKPLQRLDAAQKTATAVNSDEDESSEDFGVDADADADAEERMSKRKERLTLLLQLKGATLKRELRAGAARPPPPSRGKKRRAKQPARKQAKGNSAKGKGKSAVPKAKMKTKRTPSAYQLSSDGKDGDESTADLSSTRASKSSAAVARAPKAASKTKKKKEQIAVGDVLYYNPAYATNDMDNVALRSVVVEIIIDKVEKTVCIVTKAGHRLRNMDDVQVRQR